MKKITTKHKKTAPLSVSGFKKIKSREHITEYLYIKNGLRILYAHIQGSPTVTTNIVYHVGSKDEQTGETGLSHMLEHMLFKPTSGTGPKWKDIEEQGALLNATTWLDRTLYYFTMPTESLEDMLKVEADRMRNLVLTDTEFVPERDNVLSEYEMYNSRAEIALDWNVVSTAFQSHGYHHDTIGFRSDIESYTIEKLKSFYDTYYWPDNATLIIAGDVHEHNLLSLIKNTFGKIEKSTSQNILKVQNEAIQEGLRTVVLERDTPLRTVSIAFKVPSFRERAWTALYLVGLYLTDGETSVLHKKLVDTQLATSVHISLYPTKDPFLATITVSATEHSSYERITSIIFNEIQTLATTVIPAKTLSLLKEDFYSSDLFSRDGSHKVATQLAEYVATGDWERYISQLDEIKLITRKELQDAVKKYFIKSKATIGTLEKPINS